jgi:uncharacterized RDD family membrane protein YckC
MTQPPKPEPEEPKQPERPWREPQQPPPEPYGRGPWPQQPSYDEPPGRPYAWEGPRPRLAYSGRWQRLIAAIIDGLIVYVIIWLVTTPILGYQTMYEGSIARQTAANLIAIVIAFLYYALQHGRWGRTLGKRAMNLQVVRAEDGGAISYGQATWRLLFAYLISVITCGIGGLVDVAWILWDQRRQALHDKVARTVVMTTAGPDPYAGR